MTSVSTSVLGRMPDGRPVHVLRIGSEPDVVVEVLDLGATVHRLGAVGGDGVRRDVVLGLPDVAERLAGGGYVGGTIGRYANRIAHGRFPLDGREVQVEVHDRGNSLHGGPDGFDVRLWDVRTHTPDEVVLELVSPDGDQGFPGTVTAVVRYRVAGDVVSVTMEATTDAPTPVNLTNHAYFNLAGEGSGPVDDHVLQVEADLFTPIDGTGLPLGTDHAPVEDTPFDLRRPTRLGEATESAHPQVAAVDGLDHNFVLRGSGLRRAAVLEEPAVRSRLEVWTDQPGLQVYTGNAFDGEKRARGGGRHHRRAGVALEPQLFPDSPNRDAWPSPVLRPGDTYRSVLEWRWGRAAPGTR
ncbi:aldose 1-epimerase [Nocardioides cavernae]|uniref:Aldose 1-epimerase n=1 Tax=Nocardioides cavernae TaxID=1921566 RepID=A0A7Y9H4U8_9ACTN|nr:aldose epimerase family protein [Nocardioides cavernae]NYE37269.1 aldose 1-epimerase [Nocardioides cavernae]